MAYYEKEKFVIFDEIPESYRLKSLGRGAHGEAFLTRDGMVYKELNNGVKYPEDLRVLTTLESKHFAFPRRIIYLGERSDETLKGYLSEPKEGYQFEDIPGSTKVESIITASEHFERDMAELTRDNGMVVYDDLANNSNVLYSTTTGEFGAFDTDEYECYSLEEYPENMKHNLRIWAEYLLYNLGAYRYAFEDWKLNENFETAIMSGKYRPSIFASEMLEAVRKASGERIETLDEYNNNFGLILRKRY